MGQQGSQVLHFFSNLVVASDNGSVNEHFLPLHFDADLRELPMDARFEVSSTSPHTFTFTGANGLRTPLAPMVMNRAPESTVQISDLIECLQELNAEFPLATDISHDKSTGYVGSSASNAQRRRIRQLKFELQLIRRKNRRYDPSRLQDEQQEEKSQLGPAVPLHIVRDFDEIRYLYFAANEEAQDALDEQRTKFHLMTQETQDREHKVLEAACKAYLEAPVRKDETIRSLNQFISQQYDDDPFMLLTQLEKEENEQQYMQDPSSLYHKYPQIAQVKKHSRTKREERRDRLLNSTREKESDEEGERISSFLQYFMKLT